MTRVTISSSLSMLLKMRRLDSVSFKVSISGSMKFFRQKAKRSWTRISTRRWWELLHTGYLRDMSTLRIEGRTGQVCPDSSTTCTLYQMVSLKYSVAIAYLARQVCSSKAEHWVSFRGIARTIVVWNRQKIYQLRIGVSLVTVTMLSLNRIMNAEKIELMKVQFPRNESWTRRQN